MLKPHKRLIQLFNMKNLVLLFLLTASIALSGCAPPIDVMPETTEQYAPVPLGHVRVSTHPPEGQYKVIAEISARTEAGESVVHFNRRMQEKGAALGGDYILLCIIHTDHYIAPATEDTFSTGSAYATAYPNADGSASATGYGSSNSTSFYTPAHAFLRHTVMAKVLKITSGTNEPDMKKPSMIRRL